MSPSRPAQERPAPAGDGPPTGGIRLLGPVDLVVDGETRPVAGLATRCLLAALAVRAGQAVPGDALIEAIWGGDAPRTAPHALHVHVSSLRKLLPSGVPLVARPGGYVLQAGPGVLDSDRFEELAARGRAELSSGDPAAAVTVLDEAVALWRGPALADVPWERFAEGEVRRWEAMRLEAADDLADAMLAAGRHVEVVGDLEAHVAEQPFRERRWGQLMVALYRSGRQAEALDAYARVRSLLADELGIDPSPHLRALEAMILRQHDDLAPPSRTDDAPVTRFARGPRGRLAFQVLGDGPANLVFVPGFGGNVEVRWEEPNLARLYRRLARSARLVLLDKRGTGLSDRDTGIPPVEEEVDDVLAVMDAVGMERATILGVTDGGTIGLLTAAAHPERVDAVVTYAAFAAFEQLGDGAGPRLDLLRAQAENGLISEDAVAILAPSRIGDVAFTRWLGRYVRMASGAGGTAALLDRFAEIDVRDVLPDVPVPVLALHREHDPLVPAGNAHAIAAAVPDGRAVILPGHDTVIWSGDVDAIAAEVEGVLRRPG